MSQSRENLRTDGRTDGKTQIYKTLPAETGGPKGNFLDRVLLHFWAHFLGAKTSMLSMKVPQTQPLPGEVYDRTRMGHYTPKSIYLYKTSYVQITITNIASYAPKLSSQYVLNNENLNNLHNNKLHNGLEIRAYFLEISLRFKFIYLFNFI